MTEAAKETTARIAAPAFEPPAAAGFLGLAVFAATFGITPGTTFFGAAFPNVGFVSLDGTTSGPAAVLAWALD
jgi:hypothetical protein